MAVWLFIAQRLSALVMAPLVIGHLIVIVLAVQNGLSAEEILSRPRGSVFWGAYYGLFVLAAAVHAGIGLRAILSESLRWRGPSLEFFVLVFAAALLLLGGRAVIAVVT